jgi:predicted transposase/invertase (TIGR01784 family)
MLFNSGKAYVKQIEKGHKYSELKPVYGLSLIDDIFLQDEPYKNEYYHHYQLAHTEHKDEIIEGIELVFIELPKFKAQNITDKRLSVLWLRFLTEIDENTQEVPAELLNETEIKEALEQLHASAFTKDELAYYDKYWDNVRIEKAALQDALDQLQAERKAKELALQEMENAQQREKEAQQKLALKMLKYGEAIEEIMEETGLSKDEIENLRKK